MPTLIAFFLTALIHPFKKLTAPAGRFLRRLALSELGALTLAESAKLSDDMLVQGVMETIINESHELDFLPFIEVVGNSLQYNRLNVAPTVAWRAVGDTWTEDTPTFTEITTNLKILGGDADVDNFIQTTRSNRQDQAAAVIAQKAAALAREWSQTFIDGDVAVDANQFDGIRKIVAGLPASQTISMGVNGATLTLARLDELIDGVRAGSRVLFMSRRTRRTLQGLVRTSSVVLESRPGMFLEQIQLYNGIPIFVNDYILDTETQGTSTDCSSVYCAVFGEESQGLVGLTGPGGLLVEAVGPLETKDATRWRVKWYVSLALYSTLTLARLLGVRP